MNLENLKNFIPLDERYTIEPDVDPSNPNGFYSLYDATHNLIARIPIEDNEINGMC